MTMGLSPRVRGTLLMATAPLGVSRSIPACAGNTTRAGAGRPTRWVYPRVCGEHGGIPGALKPRMGLSPRVRGTPFRRYLEAERSRSIPACAGNTFHLRGASSAAGVYPRVCGEHTAGVERRGRYAGLSPRVRGTRPPHRQRVRDSRSIPACAGNTRPLPRCPTSTPVYPRVCGEHRVAVTRCVDSEGLSPRVRGTRYVQTEGDDTGGSIPACAGNTLAWASAARFRSVYPRVCGEHITGPLPATDNAGLSPRVWGTPCSRRPYKSWTRSIPACAGNTANPESPSNDGEVYPRVCGEHQLKSVHVRQRIGLSPRVRGTPIRSWVSPPILRSIPACAGNTPQPAFSVGHCAVYPRVCGEHASGCNAGRHGRGLSPRVRGTQFSQIGRKSNKRSIPACAGNTLYSA